MSNKLISVLRTTRAVRRRLDLDRPVSDEIIFAVHRPGGNRHRQVPILPVAGGWSFAIPRSRPGLPNCTAWPEAPTSFKWPNNSRAAVRTGKHTASSSAYLAQNMQRVPALVIPTIWGEHDGSGPSWAVRLRSPICVEFLSRLARPRSRHGMDHDDLRQAGGTR